MRLAPGTRFGRHEVRSLLGAAGMGEVYLAHDAKLRRVVAVKLLPGVSPTIAIDFGASSRKRMPPRT